MPSTIPAMLLALARQILTMLGTALVAAGYLTDSQTSDFVGGGLVVVSIAWSLLQKYRAAHETAAKELAAKVLQSTTSERAGAPTSAAVASTAAGIISLAKGV